MKSLCGAEVKEADPEELIEAYSGLVGRFADIYLKYTFNNGAIGRDDLLQEGYLSLLTAQKTYNPDNNITFATWAIYYLKARMRFVVGFKSNGTRKYEAELCLDAPALSEKESIINNLQDDKIEDNDTQIIRKEEAEAVHAAVERIKNYDQRNTIKEFYFEEKSEREIAAERGVPLGRIRTQRRNGLKSLRNDWRLTRYISSNRFRGSLSRFRCIGASVVEEEILLQENEYNREHGKNAFADSFRKREEFDE